MSVAAPAAQRWSAQRLAGYGVAAVAAVLVLYPVFYLLHKEKGAPIAFVTPDDGLPAAALLSGIADKAPHPQAARLFVDWLMSPRGQTHYQNNPYLYYGSVRKDIGPMPGGVRLTDFKLLAPTTDINEYVASRDAFAKEWNGMLGL